MTDLIDIISKYENNFDYIEAVVRTSKGGSADVREGELEEASFFDSKSAGIRVFKDNKALYYSYSGSDSGGLEDFLNSAEALFSSVEEDENTAVPSFDENTAESEDPAPVLKPETLMKKAFEIEKSALEYSTEVSAVKEAGFSEGVSKTEIIASGNRYKSYTRKLFSTSVYLLAGDDGENQDGFDSAYSTDASGDWHTVTGKRAAELAVSLMGGRPLDSGEYTVVFESSVAAQFIELIAEMLDGENIYKKTSLMCDKLGTKTASDKLTIIDDPLREEGAGYRPFDDEGTPSCITPLISEGILSSYLHNSYTARALDMDNTGHASGGKGRMGISPSNLIVIPTAMERPKEYILITDVMGMHTADPVSGDFSLGISGVVYENGERTKAFRESAMAGNLGELLESVEEIYDNARFHGRVFTGDILFGRMSVSGNQE
ncbi:TldD/PmbA family protein [Limisalsivibrio acetivorans]|uniref:TldD/PmbA family protein n=1 Tax=Limisalsivibrio acetivorans TaxID=1304888 RepID=UPI0003B39B47|nr:TldD/PmbA family protein [Limisalsivibrio acetivorans]